MGGEFAVSVAEQQRQMDALKILDAGLSSAALLNPAAFEVHVRAACDCVARCPSHAQKGLCNLHRLGALGQCTHNAYIVLI